MPASPFFASPVLRLIEVALYLASLFKNSSMTGTATSGF